MAVPAAAETAALWLAAQGTGAAPRKPVGRDVRKLVTLFLSRLREGRNLSALRQRMVLRAARHHRVAVHYVGDRDRGQRGVGGIERREIGVHRHVEQLVQDRKSTRLNSSH